MASVFCTRSRSLVGLNYPLGFQLHSHENSIEFNIAPAGDVIMQISVNTRFSCNQLNVASQNLCLAN